MRMGVWRSLQRHDVHERIAPHVAQRLGDEERDDRPSDEKPDRVDQAVEPRDGDQAGNAKKAGGAHVVAGQRQAVLQRRDALPRRIEVVGRAGLP